MDLPEQLVSDVAKLKEATGCQVVVIPEGQQLWVAVKKAAIPRKTYSKDHSDVLLQTDYQYPMSAMDMFWMEPDVTHANSSSPPHVSSVEDHAGQKWRRWSWHRNGKWQPRSDDLLSHWAFVEACWAKETPQ